MNATRTDIETEREVATFAGGCFWCMEPPFVAATGVIEVIAGYAGGTKANPTYEEVAGGTTDHLEAIQVTYDPKRIDYVTLLDIFWRQIDPTDDGGAFVDRGRQYRTAIFYHNEEQKQIAEASKASIDASRRFDRPVATEIRPYTAFYRAEAYHQKYYRKNPIRYKFYRHHSGRDRFIRDAWGPNPDTGRKKKAAEPKRYGKPDDNALKQRLTPMQYHVSRENGTEPPFDNAFWDNARPGIYVDVVSGEPLFSSTDKFDSGTGWPSFTQPLTADAVAIRTDRHLLMVRTEVRSRYGDSHLGHVFDDGPPPTGKRYCINSAALRFVPAEDLEREGYGEFKNRFKEKDMA